MTIVEPDYIWIATGGLSNLNSKRMKACKNRVIVFYLDLGAFDNWNQKAEAFNKMGYNIKTSNLLELNAKSNNKKVGFDIADFFIQNNLLKLQPTENLELMIKKNPILQTLIDKLQLVPIK